MAVCPKCERQFAEEGGFCPYDGSRLEATSPPSTQRGPGSGPAVKAVSAVESGGAAALAELGPKGNDYDRLIGTTLDGRYLIEHKLGEGGMGVVFLGRHTVIEKPVAIKVLRSEVARDHSTVKRFVQEAKAASRIGHPNIVDVTDFGTTDDGLTYSVMEFVEGQTLGAVVRAGAPLDVHRALTITAQMARALAAAHAKGIVHRDLKPENVFLQERAGRTDFVKIVDFGIAKVTPLDGSEKSRLTRAGTVFGTPEYMAPEQAAGRADTDQRVDIYALGIILYEMIVGKVPHKADSLVRTLAMQMLDPIPPPRQARPELEISDELEAVLMTALAKKREERYQKMDAFIAGLEQATGGVPLDQPKTPSAANRMPTGGRATPDAATMVPRQPPGMGAAAPSAADLATIKGEHADATPVDEPPAKSSRRSKLEPAFVARKRPLTLDVVDDEDVDGERPARWPWILALVVLLGAGGATAAMLTGRGGDEPSAIGGADAGGAAMPADAGARALATPADAAGVADDAGTPTTGGTAGRRPTRGERPGDDTGPRRMMDVQVLTRPDRATLYIDGDYSGSSGVTLTRPEGTELTVSCRLPGYRTGRTRVTFDGVNEVYLCKPERIENCVDDLKNPFDDCPDE